MKLARLYRRVSTGEQEISMDAQDKSMLDYARYKEMTIVGEYADPDVSGSIPIAKRRDGFRLMRELQPGEHLVVANLKRLGRNAMDIQATYKHLTETLKVTIHFLDMGGDSFSTDNPFNKCIIGIIALLAELDVEQIRENIQKALDYKFSQFELCGTVPYGYDAIGTGLFREKNGLRKEIMTLVENAVEAHWLREMTAWRECGLSYDKIARRLNDLGVPSKIPAGQPRKRKGVVVGQTSGQWQCGNVARVLAGKHTARLLDIEEFQRGQAA